MRLKVTVLFAAFALVASLGGFFFSPGASAAPGNGAYQYGEQIKVDECADYGTETFCYTASAEYHSVCTPSGVCNSQSNWHYECGVLTDNATGEVLYQYCDRNNHTVSNYDAAGDTRVSAGHFSYTSTQLGETFCATAQYHYVNGRLQFERLSNECD